MYEALVESLRDKAEFLDRTSYERNVHNSFADAMKQAADAIENLDHIAETYAETVHELEEQNRWISVTERLPQEWWPVLGLIQFHDEKEPTAQEVLWYLGNGHWRETWRGDMIESAVTHWMPLPEPPKEET